MTCYDGDDDDDDYSIHGLLCSSIALWWCIIITYMYDICLRTDPYVMHIHSFVEYIHTSMPPFMLACLFEQPKLWDWDGMEGNDFLDAGSTGGPAPTMTTAANPLPSMMRPNTAAAVATGGIGGLDNDNMGESFYLSIYLRGSGSAGSDLNPF